jgi:hypothetical protein
MLAYPPSWSRLAGDVGSVSVAVRDRHGGFLGYLNLTPRQAGERQANWASFRVRHNRAEGNRELSVMASARRLRFAGGVGAYVMDAYTTPTRARYVEIACLVAGAHPAVIVAAAPPTLWRLRSPTLERAIDAVHV